MKIRDNETGEVFEYGTNIHHALRISENGGCLTFENLQNGDGSLKSGDGGYSFVLDDGKTPKESNSPGAIHGMPYANIGGFHGDNVKNDGWISVEERLPENEAREYIDAKYGGIGYLYPCLVTYKNPVTRRVYTASFYYDIHQKWFVNIGENLLPRNNVFAWMPLPEPYRPERREGE